MNNDRRKSIDSILSAIREIMSQLDTIGEDIESVRDGEQDSFDAMPESLHESDRGQAMSEAIDSLENAHSELTGLDLESICTDLESARDTGR